MQKNEHFRMLENPKIAQTIFLLIYHDYEAPFKNQEYKKIFILKNVNLEA